MKVISFANGVHHTLLVMDNGKVYAWGQNYRGQLGIAGLLTSPALTKQISLPSRCKMISAGEAHTLALLEDGSLFTWGDNTSHQLASYLMGMSTKPVLISRLKGITQIASGNKFNLALNKLGEVFAWGNNQYNQLANLSPDFNGEPLKVKGLPKIVKIAAIGTTAFAIDSMGKAWVWGDPPSIGIKFKKITAPQAIPVTQKIISIAPGTGQLLFLASDRNLFSYGRGIPAWNPFNLNYQLKKTKSPIGPTLIAKDVEEVSSFDQFNYYKTKTGEIYNFIIGQAPKKVLEKDKEMMELYFIPGWHSALSLRDVVKHQREILSRAIAL